MSSSEISFLTVRTRSRLKYTTSHSRQIVEDDGVDVTASLPPILAIAQHPQVGQKIAPARPASELSSLSVLGSFFDPGSRHPSFHHRRS